MSEVDEQDVRDLASALYRLEWEADLYATPRGSATERFENRARRMLRSGVVVMTRGVKALADNFDRLAAGSREDEYDDGKRDGYQIAANGVRSLLGEPGVRLARCTNVTEPDGIWCPGVLTFRPGDLDAPCDTCGARCGYLVANYGAAPTEQAAKVWDQGYSAGFSNAMRQMSDEPNAPKTPNPYRAAEKAQPWSKDQKISFRKDWDARYEERKDGGEQRG